MSTKRRTAVYGGLVLSALLALLLAVFTGPGGRRAVLVSALVALMVQAVAFTLARLAARGNLFKAWGAGTVLRFVALLVYALVLLEPLGLPATPALLSLASLFVVTTVLESLLLTS